MFEYSDYRANYPTHGMLTLSKIYAVKTRRPLFNRQQAMGNRQMTLSLVISYILVALKMASANFGKLKILFANTYLKSQFLIPNSQCLYLNILNISSPNAYAIRPSNNTMPAICAYSITFSFGFRRVMISMIVNIA